MQIMKRTIVLLFLASTLVCRKNETVKTRSDIEQLAQILESPDRKAWQKPDEVIAMLKLHKGDIVADIGAGTGYFARRFAEAVSPDGISFAYDKDPLMVEYMQLDAERHKLSENYRAEVIQAGNLKLRSKYFHLIFLCNTIQYLQNRPIYFRQLSGSLRKDGRIVVIDFKRLEKIDEESGESPANLVDKSTVVEEFKQAGFKLVNDWDILPSQYFLEFQVKHQK